MSEINKIEIPKDIIQAIYEQGEKEAPIEACGYLGGKDGKVTSRYPMYNVDQDPEHFSMDPREQFKVLKEARAVGESLIAVYHTHPASPARPSEEDLRLANDPTISYIIASLHEGHSIKSFRILKEPEIKVVTEEIVELS